MTNLEYIDMEISETESLLSMCLTLAETLDDNAYLDQRSNMITAFYVMQQKLKNANHQIGSKT